MAGQVQTYTPSVAPISDNKDVMALTEYLQQQLQLISQSLVQTPLTQQVVLHVAPAKPREGMIVVADGTDWNPGNGAGQYTYIGGGWVYNGNIAPDLSGYLTKADNLASVASASTSRTNLGLGTAATKDVGTSANNVVQLDGSAHLPGVDGSALLNLPSQTGRLVAGTPLVMNPYATATQSSQAHGLGVQPSIVRWYLECLSTELGYAVGDRVYLVLTQFWEFILGTDTTNLFVTTTSNAPSLQNKSSNANGVITVSKWKLVATPYSLT